MRGLGLAQEVVLQSEELGCNTRMNKTLCPSHNHPQPNCCRYGQTLTDVSKKLSEQTLISRSQKQCQKKKKKKKKMKKKKKRVTKWRAREPLHSPMHPEMHHGVCFIVLLQPLVEGCVLGVGGQIPAHPPQKDVPCQTCITHALHMRYTCFATRTQCCSCKRQCHKALRGLTVESQRRTDVTSFSKGGYLITDHFLL